ncbi:hypothetical protein M409DRAFT_65420 [Zasmidium cellare ATCC 36951]|uniref:DUF7165 domain-containing protein n=1 Tax=Zasmidium cellare ATCC 36951 TaxID=1080233 RepID=A0A6A6CQC9_ZASCE|nr:uncharacterized protein M409DRAFT_65420 [Zasmidium cellare ATCC 36951]KAF2168428.1 hypothetical protein M409DRAFT_65420 [Zasmidium cellare ATCC 36951]
MPVSTFSSSHTARHHSNLIARWNSTRDRIDADERRRSMRDMQELDGTGLHDRPDWPLPSPPTPEHGFDVGKSVEQHGAVEIQDEQVEESAVLRKPEEISGYMNGVTYMDYHDDVSDIDEDDDDLEHEQNTASSVQHHLPSPPEQPSLSSPSHMAVQHHRDLASPQCETEPEVSPVREEHASSPSNDREVPDQQQPESHQQRRHLVHSEIHGRETEEEDDVNESRDVATPIPFGTESPESRQGQQHRNTPPHVNGNTTPTPTINGANHRSSIAKGPMHTPPHRRTSTRSSWVSTTQIPHNKERVRYSWQSVQDDEPNRPRIHIIKLVSNVATASAGFPTGEAFGFSISPGGRRIAAFNSSRLYVLQTNALPVGISQDFALKRRPLAVELIDEANVMAVLADDHTVNVYDLGLHLRRIRTIKLDFPSSCIALAPTGGLLAAAYEGGVEIFSLAPEALPTDRRAVRSTKMDRLCFSDDGSTLLGTTTRINVSSTVVVQVPVFPSLPNNTPTHEELKEAWCSELLHPDNIRNSSHATFMREDRKTCNERLFAWNGVEDTFGILNVSDLQYGNIDFPVVISPPLSTCGGLGAAIHSCPAIDEHGDTVAMIVNDRTIRLYIVPHKADGEETTSVEAHSIDHELDEGYGCPFSEVRWVYSSSSLPAPLNNQTQVKGRLIVTSPGGVTESGISEESVEDIEGGRIILFDFDPQFAGQPGQTFTLTLGKSPPQLLEEEQVDVADQVAIVRRRTVNQSKGGGLSHRPAALGRAATTYGRRDMRSASPALSNFGAHRNRSSMMSIGSMQSEGARSLPDLVESNEQADVVLEEPYIQGAPRSQASLQRAASNAQRHRFQTIEERNQERVSVESSGNFLPLPEYTEEPNAPLPSRYRAMAGLDGPKVFNPEKPTVVANPNSNGVASASSSVPQTAPADVGEHFSADLAFRAANAQASSATRETMLERPRGGMVMQSPVSTPSSIPQSEPASSSFAPTGPQRTGTFDSIGSTPGTGTYASFRSPEQPEAFESVASLPRSLQRAYSNAIANGPPPKLVGDWNNVSPIPGRGVPDPIAVWRNERLPPSSTSSNQGEEPWDVISPVGSSPRQGPPFGQPAGNPYRYSTSLLNPPGHLPPHRAPSSAGSFATMPGTTSAPSSAGGRRMPPHMQAFRSAAAANANAIASASLFPPSQPPDHVPFRPNTVKAGTVAHPITAWHPPAASTPALRTSGSMRGHSRKSSLAGRSAFASTAKAKKLGFFKKSKKPDPFSPSHPNGEMLEGSSVMETKSMMTWMTKSDNKCSVM